MILCSKAARACSIWIAPLALAFAVTTACANDATSSGDQRCDATQNCGAGDDDGEPELSWQELNELLDKLEKQIEDPSDE